MSERPDQWYIDALERKHKARVNAYVFVWWAKAVVLAMIALGAFVSLFK